MEGLDYHILVITAQARSACFWHCQYLGLRLWGQIIKNSAVDFWGLEQVCVAKLEQMVLSEAGGN